MERDPEIRAIAEGIPRGHRQGVADLLQLAREDAEQLEDGGDLTRFEEFGGEIRVWVNHLGWVEIDRPGQSTSDQVDGWDEVRQLCSDLRELA